MYVSCDKPSGKSPSRSELNLSTFDFLSHDSSSKHHTTILGFTILEMRAGDHDDSAIPKQERNEIDAADNWWESQAMQRQSRLHVVLSCRAGGGKLEVEDAASN